MAREKVTSMLGDILGASPRKEDSVGLTEEQIERLQITPEMREALNAERYKNAGRPKNGTQKKGCTKGTTRATFIVREDTVEKIKKLSYIKTASIRDIVEEAFTEYIAKWEAANGPIK